MADPVDLVGTDRIDETTTFDASDFRTTVPRPSPEFRKANRDLVDVVTRVAERKHSTPAQIGLAWILSRKRGSSRRLCMARPRSSATERQA